MRDEIFGLTDNGNLSKSAPAFGTCTAFIFAIWRLLLRGHFMIKLVVLIADCVRPRAYSIRLKQARKCLTFAAR
jgi:hypothetical protein